MKDSLRRSRLREGARGKGRSQKAPEPYADSESRKSRSGRNDILPSLRIELCAIGILKLPARKLRKNDLTHVREVANSINSLGFNVPLLVGTDNLVLDGGSRLEAAKLLGLLSVPCIRVDHLDVTEQRLLRLAVNRLGEKGARDLGELEAEFKELVIADAPIEITGFGIDEVEQIFIGAEVDRREAVDLAASESLAIARVGDLFRLGTHRVICGDATDPAVIRRLMGNDVARLIFTDEPLESAILENVKGAPRKITTASEETKDAKYLDFNQKWMDAVLPYLLDGGILGTFIDWGGLPVAHGAAMASGLMPLNLVVWAKTDAGPGTPYASQHELLPLFKKGTAPQIDNISRGKQGRRRTNLWTYAGAASLEMNGQKSLQDHPTVKPTAMLQDALNDLTNGGDVVLDPFLGFGSTLMAAEKCSRVCCGVAGSALYRSHRTAIRGSNGYEQVLADTDEPFATVAVRRRDGRDGERQ
jgi:DNA modification methylase